MNIRSYDIWRILLAPYVLDTLLSVFGRQRNLVVLILFSKNDRFRRPFKPSGFKPSAIPLDTSLVRRANTLWASTAGLNLVPRAIMSFSCRTQPPVMTLVPTYTFVCNLFQAFVMYARVGLRGSRRFGLVLTGTSLRLARNRRRSMFADMQQIQNVNTEMKPNMQARTFEDSVIGKISMETQAI